MGCFGGKKKKKEKEKEKDEEVIIEKQGKKKEKENKNELEEEHEEHDDELDESSNLEIPLVKKKKNKNQGKGKGRLPAEWKIEDEEILLEIIQQRDAPNSKSFQFIGWNTFRLIAINYLFQNSKDVSINENHVEFVTKKSKIIETLFSSQSYELLRILLSEPDKESFSEEERYEVFLLLLGYAFVSSGMKSATIICKDFGFVSSRFNPPSSDEIVENGENNLEDVGNKYVEQKDIEIEIEKIRKEIQEEERNKILEEKMTKKNLKESKRQQKEQEENEKILLQQQKLNTFIEEKSRFEQEKEEFESYQQKIKEEEKLIEEKKNGIKEQIESLMKQQEEMKREREQLQLEKRVIEEQKQNILQSTNEIEEIKIQERIKLENEFLQKQKEHEEKMKREEQKLKEERIKVEQRIKKHQEQLKVEQDKIKKQQAELQRQKNVTENQINSPPSKTITPEKEGFNTPTTTPVKFNSQSPQSKSQSQSTTSPLGSLNISNFHHLHSTSNSPSHQPTTTSSSNQTGLKPIQNLNQPRTNISSYNYNPSPFRPNQPPISSTLPVENFDVSLLDSGSQEEKSNLSNFPQSKPQSQSNFSQPDLIFSSNQTANVDQDHSQIQNQIYNPFNQQPTKPSSGSFSIQQQQLQELSQSHFIPERTYKSRSFEDSDHEEEGDLDIKKPKKSSKYSKISTKQINEEF